MIPRHIIKVPDIPRGANEKADIVLLKKIYAIPTQANSISLENTDISATIIKELENLGLSNINLDEDIFNQGLDSLMLFSLIANLEDSGIVINPEDIFAHPTINKLSSYIASLKNTKAIATDFNSNSNLKLYDNIIKDVPRDISAILLTGATDFLGINLLHSLLHSTDASVYCILRDKSIYEGLNRASPHNMIIRLGNLMPREKGNFIGNPLDNAMYQRIKHICSIGFVPKELLNLYIDWTFVDHAAASVVKAIRTENKNTLIEIVQYNSLTLEKLINILNDIGYSISEVPMKLWLNNFSSGIGALMHYELQRYLIEGNIQYNHELKKDYMFTEPLNLQEIKEALKKLL